MGSEGSPQPIRVLIADDHGVVRAGLRRILELESDIQVVGEAENGAQAVELAARLQPDVVLMDISMPELNGLEATRQLRQRAPRVRVVTLTIHADDAYVVEMCRAGAWGYLLKDDDPGAVAKAIRQVAGGEVFIPSRLVSVLVRALRQDVRPAAAVTEAVRESAAVYEGRPSTADRSSWPELTEREAEVLTLIAQGKSNRQIAQALVISEKTVKNHVTSILRKLRLKDRTQAAIWALRSGWNV